MRMELEQEEQELEQLQEELEEDEEQQYRCPHYKRKCQFVVSSGVLAGARMPLLAGGEISAKEKKTYKKHNVMII